jgi:hypothetical protein
MIRWFRSEEYLEATNDEIYLYYEELEEIIE